MVTGVFLALLGLYFWITNYYPQFDLFGLLNLDKNWPIVLVLVGFYLIVKQYNGWNDADTK